MHRIQSTVEDQLILKAINEECPWDRLPKRLHFAIPSKEEWHRRVVQHCIKKRLSWSACFARKIIKEVDYYEDMIRYLRKNLAIFPYKQAEYICRVLRVTPFRYYCDMIFEVMKNEQPYDSIPNFSAADALRVTGIGRNEFIDIMNKCRSKVELQKVDISQGLSSAPLDTGVSLATTSLSQDRGMVYRHPTLLRLCYEQDTLTIKKFMWKINKSIAKELLPTGPVDVPIEPWWVVCLVNLSLEEFKKLSEDEMAMIDKVCKEETNTYIRFDPDIIKGLYRRGLIYFDVPVYPNDRFKVSKLEGFVSNKDQSYDDPVEEFLYSLLVVASENATVAELAATLQVDPSQLESATSFLCRLGWAVKQIDPASILQDSNADGSLLSEEDDGSSARVSSARLSVDGSSTHECPRMESNRPASNQTCVAFTVDANITSYLMMGSVSPGLKSHAVTLYEAGRLGHASIADLCKDLSTLEGKHFEGELENFANHASSLCSVLLCLLSGGTSLNDEGDEGPNTHDHRISELDGDTTEAESKRKRRCRVDILRCESLASLRSSALEHLLTRDYHMVVSMIPLPPSSILPGSNGPVHFGPPTNSSTTPWMKLVLYTSARNGPLSVVLMKGQRLRLLPAPLAGCEKALIWSWDGSSVGGLGDKIEGNLVHGNLLLHCLNSLLCHSPVLVQPLSKEDLDKSGNAVTIDIPLPLRNSDGSIINLGEEFGLRGAEASKLTSTLKDLSQALDLWTTGYIRLIKVFTDRVKDCPSSDEDKYEWLPLSVEFGVPLSRPKLCSRLCKRVIRSQLLQTEWFPKHHETMQALRKKLRDMCAEYHATGPTARLLYHKQKPTNSSSRCLMSYASGRWNPLLDPSSPSSVNDPKIKLTLRQQSRREVLSFDGCTLRTYALNPIYETATLTIDASNPDAAPDMEPTDTDGKVVLPGVNLLFDGLELHPFDLGACYQARQPVCLVAEAQLESESYTDT